MIALSNEPLGITGILLSKGFISDEILSKMLVVSYTQIEKATILIEAVRDKVKLAPSKFTEFLDILSEMTCAKEVVKSLHSTYQCKLISLVDLHQCLEQTVWQYDSLFPISRPHPFYNFQILFITVY